MSRKLPRFVYTLKTFFAVVVLFLFAFGQALAIERVSITEGGLEANGGSTFPSISSDGRYVAFQSVASNLVSGDTNGVSDIFVYDRITDDIERVSINDGDVQGNAASVNAVISADGRYVAFNSDATNLVSGDDEGFSDVFVYDRQLGTIERVSVNGLGDGGNNTSNLPDISSDGRYVTFISFASDLVGSDTNVVQDIFVYDRNSDSMDRVSVDSIGTEANDASGISNRPSISGDGRYIVFDSIATNLIGTDANTEQDVFVHDSQTGETRLVSVDDTGLIQGNGTSVPADISSNGRYVVFVSSASNLVGSDGNGSNDVFVYDLTLNDIEIVSIDNDGNEGDGDSDIGFISDDGRYVAFASFATNLVAGDGNSDNDVFVYDRTEDMVRMVSIDSSGDEGDAASYRPVISNDGLFVAFMSSATDLVAGDVNGALDIFVNDVPHAPTDISLVDTSIDENRPIGSTVTGLSVTDANISDTHTYTFSCAVPGANDASFSISGNSLLSAVVFNYESQNSYSICIRVDDGNGGTYDENFTITINDVNETSGSGGGGGGGGGDDDPIEGCTDTSALNYDANADTDDGSCQYGPVVGCTDPLALNYDASATVSGGVCTYSAVYYGCTDTNANNFDSEARIDDGSCTYNEIVTDPISGCMDPGASNYDAAATVPDGSCAYVDTPIVTDPPIGGGGGGPTGGGGGGSSSGGSLDPKDILEVAVPAGIAVPLIVMLFRDPGIVASLLSIPVRIATLIPTLMGYRRRKRPWGTVYDSVTKQPLDPVYVTLLGADGAEVGTSITDIDGRYGFLVSPGTYRISSNKADYVFPSQKLSGKTSDELYDNLYFGGEVMVENKDTIINKNIPMDALKFNWNEFEKAKNKRLMRFYSSLDLFFARISKILFAAGLVSTVTLSIVAPSTIQYVFLGVYCAIIVLHIFGIKPKSGGYVFERANGFPMSFGIVRVFSAELGREIAHTVIGKTGKYFMLVPKGKYYMKIQKKTGEDSYVDIYTSDAFKARNGYVDRIIKI